MGWIPLFLWCAAIGVGFFLSFLFGAAGSIQSVINAGRVSWRGTTYILTAAERYEMREEMRGGDEFSEQVLQCFRDMDFDGEIERAIRRNNARKGTS